MKDLEPIKPLIEEAKEYIELLNNIKSNPEEWKVYDRGPLLGYDIEGVEYGTRGMFEYKEDACLAAAAPKMAELLKKFVKFFEIMHDILE